MTCRDIIEIIEEAYPRSYAMEWDNVGLLAGRRDKEVHRIYLAVDATDAVVEEAIAKKSDLLITHHPLIFGSIKKVTDEDFIGKRLVKLIQHDISYYAMHTNYDVLGMAEVSAGMLHMENAEVLKVTEDTPKPEGIGRIAALRQSVSLEACAEEVKRIFSLEHVKIFGDLKREIRRIAVCPGSGGSVIEDALLKKADVLITGDIGHHEGIDAVAQGLCIVDAGHYGVEHIFVEDMRRYLTEKLRETAVEGEPIRHPFTVI